MGFRVEIDGINYEVEKFSVTEAATPLAAGDSSGQVGQINLTIPYPDPDLFPNHDITLFGPQILNNSPVRLVDTRKGFTLGTVTSASRTDSSGTFTLSCASRLGRLNVYNIQAQPFVGTLRAAFTYYMGLANLDSDILVDDSIANRQVVFPGWTGELWFHLKQMATAIDCDVSLVSGVILLRPIRAREATRGRFSERSSSGGGGSLAQNIEIYHYNNKPITNKLVYPPGGWSENVSVINVNAGETVEEIVQLSASVTSIQQPVMQTFVSREHNTSSVFTVVGDDGLPITPAAWSSRGGSLSVSINPDTTSLTVRIMAPTGLPNKDGAEIGVYSISLSSENSTGRYSTLRIIGSGVAFDKKLVRVPTGITPRQTATEVGVTIDNPFISNLAELYRTGSRAARAFTGKDLSLSGTVLSVNQLGDTGDVTYPTYQFVQDANAGKTYDQVKASMGATTYRQYQDTLENSVRDEFENQVFGNVNGARIWDTGTNRWYRIREATLNPDVVSFTADDDMTNADMKKWWQGKTYAQIKALMTDRTYFTADLMGGYNGN